MKDDEREAKGALSKVVEQLKQKDPAWWKEGVDTYAQACRDKLDELAEKHGSLAGSKWEDVERQIRIDLDAAVLCLKQKLAARTMEDDVRNLRSTLNSVTSQLAQKDYHWWETGLANRPKVLDQLASLEER